MRVQSPVGTFPLEVRRVRIRDGAVSIDTALGAWASEVRLERGDAALVGAAVGTLLLSFLAGRATARRRR